ncbi:hypothetical protein HanPI659440_Chr08g0282321 [Helianthus annuus]|nr:hypothetical protein HanPI659440_Chr08g0282321 [Helianthus annuus]
MMMMYLNRNCKIMKDLPSLLRVLECTATLRTQSSSITNENPEDTRRRSIAWFWNDQTLIC